MGTDFECFTRWRDPRPSLPCPHQLTEGKQEMTTQEQTGSKRSAGLVLACLMAMSLAVVGCGSLAAASGVGGSAAQRVLPEPEEPPWVPATAARGQPAP